MSRPVFPLKSSAPRNATAIRNAKKFYYRRLPLYSFMLAGILVAGHWVSRAATTVIWDSSSTNQTDGAQDGSGTWNSTNSNWWDSALGRDVAWLDSTGISPVIAQFGNGGTATAKTVTLATGFQAQVAGLLFANSGTPSTTNVGYTLTGGTISLDANGTITIANGTSASGNFVTINSALTGSNITIQRTSGSSAEEFIALGGTNNLTGTLTISSSGGSLFVRSANTGALNSVDTVVVQAGDTLNLQVTGTNTTYTSNFVVAGGGTPVGANSRGAIRFESAMTLSGNVTLAGNAVLNFQSATPTPADVIFQKGIGEQGGSFSFTKTGLGKLTLQGPSTYTGSTIIAPAGSGIDPGTILLDFSNSTVTDNLLYNGVTPGSEGALVLTGNGLRANASSTATLAILGADVTDNTQKFGGLTVSGPTAITLTAGLIGSVELSLGSITRASVVGTTLAITAPSTGSISTTTNIGTMLGTWATYTDPNSLTTWAGVAGDGTITSFTGDVNYGQGSSLSDPAYNQNSNVAITSITTGAISQGVGTTKINTITMKGTNADRTVTVGAGNILNLGQTGGIQLVAGSRSLVIGAPGNAGTLTAGTTAGAELFLSNFDTLNTITINSVIANNAGGAVNVVLNGIGTTILTAANTYTGATIINGGLLEIQNNTALGTGATTVGFGATLGLTNGITVSKNISISGTGVNGLGALRSMGGNNIFNGVITLNAAATVTADAGSMLTLQNTGTTNVFTAPANTAYSVTFGGAGTIVVNNPVNIVNGGVVKNDSGTTVLNAASTYAGSTTINNGILRITNAAALGTTAGGTTVNTNGTLELWSTSPNTLTIGTETLGLNGNGANNIGALHSIGNNTYTGKITLGSASRINSDSGTLTLDNAAGIVSSTSSSPNNSFTITFGGSGDIVLKQTVNTQTGTGTASVIKDGSGNLVLAPGNAYTGTTNILGGTISMTANDTFADTSALTLVGGTLAMGSFSDTVGAVTLRSGAITGTGTLTASSFTVQSGSIGVQLAGTAPTVGLTKVGSDTFTLNSNVAFNLSGPTTVSAGRLVLDYSAGTTILPTNTAINLAGGNLEVRGGGSPGSPTAVTLGAVTAVANTGLSTLTVDANTALNLAGYTRSSATAAFFDLSAAGSSITFASTNKPTVINGVLVGTNGSNASITMKDSSGRSDFAALDANNSVVRLNASTVLPTSGGSSATNYVLSGDKTLTANVSANTLRIDTTNAGGTLDLAGKTLSLNQFGVLMDGSNDFTITSSSAGGFLSGVNAVFLYQYGTGKLTLDAQITGTGPQTFLMGTGLIDWTASAGNAGTNYIFGATVRMSGTGLSLAGGATGNGIGVVNIGNNGILELNSGDLTRAVGGGANQVNFYSGGAGFSAYGQDRVVNLGGGGVTLVWGNPGVTGSATATANFLASGSKLILGSQYANATVDFQNGLNLNAGAQTVEVQSQNTAGVGGKISGVITGGGSFSKTGQGILTLAAANTYTAQTLVKAGTLQVTGSINGSSAVNVDSGAELKLSGAGSIIAGTLSLADSSKLSLEVGTLTSSTISLTGNATLSGNITLSLTLTADPLDGTLFTLIDGSSALAGYDTGARFIVNGSALANGSTFNVTSGSFSQSFTINYQGGADGNDVTLTAVVPEPEAWMTLCASFGLSLGISRLRRRRSPHLTAVS